MCMNEKFQEKYMINMFMYISISFSITKKKKANIVTKTVNMDVTKKERPSLPINN